MSRAFALANLLFLSGHRTAEALRIRQPGGGRKPLTQRDSDLLSVLESRIEPTTRGDPESPLRWTCKSTRVLAEQLRRRNHPVGDSDHVISEQPLTVRPTLLRSLRYSRFPDQILNSLR
ncbi:MAG: hypothetical protein JW955_02315 [Sedimentisphaerales bacterium]|nr:hypothetical protein [Sedimentisphaerales bacterium]